MNAKIIAVIILILAILLLIAYLAYYTYPSGLVHTATQTPTSTFTLTPTAQTFTLLPLYCITDTCATDSDKKEKGK